LLVSEAATIEPAARLPGITFEVAAPPPAEVLPRMDIAGFVGFASSGPIGVPVAVQDAAQFATVFGADAPIAWDPIHGEQAYALLGPAVRAFFRNGGQRCWVVRVADATLADRDCFELPGVATADQDGTLGFAILQASSCGSWADGAAVTTALQSAPLTVGRFSTDPLSATVAVPPGSELGPGDVIRLQFPNAQTTLYAVVTSVTAVPSPPTAAPAVEAQLGRQLWVSPADALGAEAFEISFLGPDGAVSTAMVTASLDSPSDGLTTLTFGVPQADAPSPGALTLGTASTTDGGRLLFDVAQAIASNEGIVAIVGSAMIARQGPGHNTPGPPDALAEQLTLSVTVTGTGDAPITLGGLGLAAGAGMFLGGLPTDEQRYSADAGQPPSAQPGFPLAGPDTVAGAVPLWYLPVGATIVTGPPLGAMFDSRPALERDGLTSFAAELFADQRLRDEPVSTLVPTAAGIAQQSPDASPLQGMHALLFNDEVTLLAIPDAAQRGWTQVAGSSALPPAPPTPVPSPDWSTFLPCSTRMLTVPQFPRQAGPPLPRDGGVIHLTWTSTDASDAQYELQQSGDPDFDDAEQLYLGPTLEFDLSRPPAGSNIYLRVRATAGDLQSGWSDAILLQLTGDERWFLNDPTSGYSPQTLIDVQIAALRLCVARGDVLALLAMPEHYRSSDAIAHVHALKASGDLAPGSGTDPIFGFGALYHPWGYCSDTSDPTSFRRTPLDGGAAGIAAARAIARGAWVAPANVALEDVLALDSPIADSDFQALANAHVNFVRDDPSGFLWLAADTLSDDADLRPISVRRLLALLRRTAERYGNAHVFEPNTDVSRRTARRSFQTLLSFMYSAGAFAGATADEGFQVSTPVTAGDLDAGRLIIELRVAPSQPLAFLTIRLAQTGAGTLQVLTR
jgi:hypothetical protein